MITVVFMGTPEWAIPSLKVLFESDCEVAAIYTQPDRPVGRKRTPTPSAVKQFAIPFQIPIETPTKVSDPTFLTKLRQYQPDLLIVCAYGQILSQELLDLPTIGCFNLHFSLLPRWRGASPVQAAIANGDTETGVTLQKMVHKLDAGALVVVSPLEPIHPTDTYQSLGNRLAQLSGELLQQILPNLQQQAFTLTPQNEAEITFCRMIKKKQGQIDWWHDSAVEIERKLRAYTPWPGIYTFDEQGKRIQITQVEIDPQNRIPGIVAPNFFVGTAQQSLKILKLKPEGKTEMSGEAYLRGCPKALRFV